MMGVEEELLPHRTSIEEDNIVEERRLMYVGITRARESLAITQALTRKQYGEKVDTLVDTGAKEFVTTDCGCLMNIAGYAEKNQKPVTGQHILSFLWERTSSGGEQS